MKDGFSKNSEEDPLKPGKEGNEGHEKKDEKKLTTQYQNYDIMVNNPERDPDNFVNIKSNIIWEGFPLSERFWYSFCCQTKCCSDYKNGDVFTTQCFRQKCTIDKKLKNLNKKLLSISVIKTGTLEIMPMILHPFVRISIVNLKTGKYIQKSDFNIPCLSRKEKNFIMNNNKEVGHMEFSSSVLDIIPPFATCPYDLRERGESYAEWNEDFYINEKASNLLDDNNIFFFELLDYNLDYNLNQDEECIIPIAWGYLKPVGFSQTYMGKHKIQLYKYKFRRTKQLSILKKTDRNFMRTPDLLYELDWIKKEKYQTFLQIKLGLENFPTKEQMENAYFINKYTYSVFLDESEKKDIIIKSPAKPKEEEVKPDTSKEEQLSKWRIGKEKCIIPDKLLYKFSTAKLGCLTHEFSHNGKYIAAACTELNSETHIKIFNVEDGLLRYVFKGHHNIIHHFTWSKDDLILISASADNIVTLWRIPKHETSEKDNLNPLENMLKFKIHDINHPAYVYSTDIFPSKNKETMILATACFDGLVRIYIIKFDYDDKNMKYNWQKCDLFFEITITEDILKDKQHFKGIEDILKDEKIQKKDKEKLAVLRNTALDHRHPNVVVFDITGRLYIGDSLGYIHIWLLSIDREYPKMEKIKTITHKELEYGTINNITIVPNQSQKLIVHTRDNCIRLLDISKEKTTVSLRFFGLKCWKTNIKSTCSPDGSYLFSGSEEGEPKMWQLDTGISYSTSKYECGFIDSVNDVSWNEKYNMNALSGFGQEYPLLVYVYERKDPLPLEDIELIGKEKIANKNYEGSGLFKPMIEDTKDLKEEENMFNTKFNIKNNYMSNFGNPFTNNHIDASNIFNNNLINNNNSYMNNHITNNSIINTMIHSNNNNIGQNDELHNVLPDDYIKKADEVN